MTTREPSALSLLRIAWLAMCVAGGCAHQQPARVLQVPPSAGSTGINRAIMALGDRGGEIVLEAGTYRCTSPVILRHNGITLRGSGHGTLLRLAAKASCPVVIIGDEANSPRRPVNRVSLLDLAIDGNRSQQIGECWNGQCDTGELTALRSSGVVIRRAHDIRVERVSATNCRSGGLVTEKHCRRLLVRQFSADRHEFDGLACYETEDSVFEDLELHDNPGAGISTDLKFARNLIRNARMERNGSHGIFMRDSNHNRFEDIVIRDSGASGIFIAQDSGRPETGCVSNRFSRIEVTGSKGPALQVNDASCERNSFATVRFADNKVGLHEASPGLVSMENLHER